MENKPYRIKILKSFTKSLQSIFSYIWQSSPKNAEDFEKDLYNEMEKISKNPLANPTIIDEKGNPTKFRYKNFKKNYKIVFKVEELYIKFIRLFHSKQHPTKLNKDLK